MRLYNHFIKDRCRYCNGNVIVQYWHTEGLTPPIREATCMMCARDHVPAVIMGLNNKPKFIARSTDVATKEFDAWAPIST